MSARTLTAFESRNLRRTVPACPGMDCGVRGWTAGGDPWRCGAPAVSVNCYSVGAYCDRADSVAFCVEHATQESDDAWRRRVLRQVRREAELRQFWRTRDAVRRGRVLP